MGWFELQAALYIQATSVLWVPNLAFQSILTELLS